MNEYEFILQDRLGVIRDTINKYGADKFYLSFSGGKDSLTLHYLLDMAIPNNNIPRVFVNTGIEYIDIVDFVKELASKDKRIITITPNRSIKGTLEKYGYPFKSKEHAQTLGRYQNHIEETQPFFKEIEANKELLNDFDYIHNLPKNTKNSIKYFYGVRERESCTSLVHVPNILKYQFEPAFNLKLSDKCCEYLKERPVKEWEKKNNKQCAILGLMEEEGGRRSLNGKCIAFQNDKPVHFSPLIKVTSDWQSWFIDKYNIKLCKLYYEPYNFKRTGCKGCPFSLKLAEQLETMARLLPAERKQCELIWKPVYEEYRRIGYRLQREEQIKLL